MQPFTEFLSLTRNAVVIACLSLLAGCMGGSSGPIRYYLIDPVTVKEPGPDADHALAVEILDLHVPQYLERFHIATRSGVNRLSFSEQHQWSESLRKNLMRTLARNLSQSLNTVDIATPLNRSSSQPDVRVHVHIEQFERDIDGVVKLAGRWQVIDGQNNQPLATRRAELAGKASVREGDYAGMVADMRDLFGRFSGLIAESIINRSDGGT